VREISWIEQVWGWILSLQFWYLVHCGYFTLVLMFKKYCIKIVCWLLSFGAPLEFCARSECLAHLTLSLGLEQHWWDHHLVSFHPLSVPTQQVAPAHTWHSSPSFPGGAHLQHRILAWTDRNGNRPGVFPESKARKVLILHWTAVFGFDLLLDSS